VNQKRIRAVLMATAFLIVNARAAEETAPVVPAAPVALAPPAVAPVIYDTALASGWQNWSWAKAELSVELAGSARKPIRVVAGPYEALYLHHEPFSTTGFKMLTLLIQGSAPDGQVRIHGLIDGKVASDGYPVKIGNAGWTQVKVPLATLGVEDKLANGFWVQNATGTPLPKFFVTDIKLE
jgi:hypothetical protein